MYWRFGRILLPPFVRIFSSRPHGVTTLCSRLVACASVSLLPVPGTRFRPQQIAGRTDGPVCCYISLADSLTHSLSPTHSRFSPLPPDHVTQGDSREVVTHVAVRLWGFLNSNCDTVFDTSGAESLRIRRQNSSGTGGVSPSWAT